VVLINFFFFFSGILIELENRKKAVHKKEGIFLYVNFRNFCEVFLFSVCLNPFVIIFMNVVSVVSLSRCLTMTQNKMN